MTQIKIIIPDEMSDNQALDLVQDVVASGKISKGSKGDQYAWATRFSFHDGSTTVLTCHQTETMEVFRIAPVSPGDQDREVTP